MVGRRLSTGTTRSTATFAFTVMGDYDSSDLERQQQHSNVRRPRPPRHHRRQHHSQHRRKHKRRCCGGVTASTVQGVLELALVLAILGSLIFLVMRASLRNETVPKVHNLFPD